MVEINYKIVITGIICLAVIFATLIICGKDNQLIETMIVSIIALSIGVIIPSPKIDNKIGVLIW